MLSVILRTVRHLYTFHSKIDANYVASLRPRIGVPIAGALVYVTGGVAMTTLNYEHRFLGAGFNDLFGTGFAPPIFEYASRSETKAGWTVGGGVELPIDAIASLKSNISSPISEISRAATTRSILCLCL